MKAIEVQPGRTYGRLTATGRHESRVQDGKPDRFAEFVCACGTVCWKSFKAVRRGSTTSCGCRSKELTGDRFRKHGAVGTALYKIWNSMKVRCYGTKSDVYPNYGGRGVRICDAWRKDFGAFRAWAEANEYTDGKVLERLDDDGHYEAGNCRWVAPEKRSRRRGSRMIEAFGETKSLADWVRDARCTVDRSAVRQRLELGTNAEDAISMPPRPRSEGVARKKSPPRRRARRARPKVDLIVKVLGGEEFRIRLSDPTQTDLANALKTIYYAFDAEMEVDFVRVKTRYSAGLLTADAENLDRSPAEIASQLWHELLNVRSDGVGVC